MRFADFVTLFGAVEQPNGEYLAHCPAHDDKDPSLLISLAEDGKILVHCRVHCDTDAVLSAKGLTSKALRASGDRPVTPARRPVPAAPRAVAALRVYAEAAGFALLDFTSEVAELARDYLAQRFGLTMDDAADLFLGVDDGGPNTFPYRPYQWRRFPRLVVPFSDFDGVLRGAQGRDLTGQCPARWMSLTNPSKGERWAPYGVFRTPRSTPDTTLITEGPSDALTAVAAGFTAVAVRGAALASPRLAAALAAGLAGSRVVVAGDADEAGRAFTRRLVKALAAHRIDVHTLALPRDGDDLTAWHERNPQGFSAELTHAVAQAHPVATAQPPAPAAPALDNDGQDRTPERLHAQPVTTEHGAQAAGLLAELVAQYGESDVVNAYALSRWTDYGIRYAPGLGFFVWSGSEWERSDLRVRQEVHRMGASLVLNGSLQQAKGFTTTSRIRDLMTELRAVPEVHVTPQEFDAQPDLLSFRNGTVDLRTGELRPHAKEDMLTYTLDIDYRPDAQAPRWETYLSEIFPHHPEMPDYMRRLIGYGITGHTSEQCFCVLWGKGANGKSVFTDTLTSVFREISRTTPFSTFEAKQSGGIPNDIAALRGARLAMASEGESARQMNESVLKRMTGKDVISARFMRQEFFEFKPSFLLLLATNHKPRFRGQDDGLWRRIKMIPFTRRFAKSERDEDLDRKLLAEAEGIAAWAVRGAAEWYRSGLADPPVIEEATQEYRETSDALAGFFPGVLEPAADSSQMNGTEAFNRYLEWCEQENLPERERWTRRGFYNAMEERGVTRKKTERGIALLGISEAVTPERTGPGIFAKT